ncbi:hypothetical protein AAEU29_12645 [Pseudoalteromonas sp. SSM20]|uniref:hypothetical protein n=1 Tax=Pseudoalteromonas sp. SSM20 TaxID=3139394 RepID=UPI003BAB35D3
MAYSANLDKCKEEYPFSFWYSLYEKGIGKYSKEYCEEVRDIFDDLIERLKAAESFNSNDLKVEEVKKAVLSLNKIRDTKPFLIETMEREEFCDLFDSICEAAEIKKLPSDFTLQWRNW